MNCFVCGDKLKGRYIELSNRMHSCHKCFENNHGFVCDSCGGKYMGDEYNVELKVCFYCAKGMKEEDEAENKIFIHNYYYKPYPIFFKKGNEEDLYFGIELEIGGNKNYQNINKFAAKFEDDFFYIKKDRSIPKYGCEIVSHPATYQYHKDNKWNEILKKAKELGFKSYNIDNCGLHIHVNRNYFDNYEIAKLDCFFNKNCVFFTKMARRESKYSRFLSKPAHLYGLPINVNRHCALNLCNENTIEFRIFKGTLKTESIIATIELVYCLITFIKTFKFDFEDYLNANPIDEFINYIKNQNVVYLNDFLIKNLS